MKNNKKISTSVLVKVSMLAAICFVLMYFEFPILPAFPWLKIDLSDIPALIGTFIFGPVYGIVIEGLKNILAFIFKGSHTGGVGELANFIIGASFVYSAGLIYNRNKTRKNAIISVLIGTVAMSIVGVLANYFILIPLYFKEMPKKDLINYIIYGVIPFNFIKASLVSIITVLSYKKIAVLIRQEIVTENVPKKTA